MNAVKITGKTRALRTVVKTGRTRTSRRFFRVSVQICLKKSFKFAIVA